MGVSDIYSQEAYDALNQILAIDLNAIVNYLLSDAPYELYWYDKTAETRFEIGSYAAEWAASHGFYLVEE